MRGIAFLLLVGVLLAAGGYAQAMLNDPHWREPTRGERLRAYWAIVVALAAVAGMYVITH